MVAVRFSDFIPIPIETTMKSEKLTPFLIIMDNPIVLLTTKSVGYQLCNLFIHCFIVPAFKEEGLPKEHIH